MLNTVCKRWWVLMVRGLAAIALGICAMVWPGVTLVSLVYLFVAFSIVDGIAAIILGLRGEADGTVWWTMVYARRCSRWRPGSRPSPGRG